MNVVVVGEKDYPEMDQVEDFVSRLPATATVLTTPESEVGQHVRDAAQLRGLDVVEESSSQSLVDDAEFVIMFGDDRFGELSDVSWRAEKKFGPLTFRHITRVSQDSDYDRTSEVALLFIREEEHVQ